MLNKNLFSEKTNQLKTMETITITPQKASLLLKNNTRNRPVSEHRVNQYAQDMETGNWKLNGETIKLDTNGVILDGQHRLHACIKANKSFSTYILYNLNSDVFDTIDTGKNRNGADVLSIKDVKYYSLCAAAIKLYLTLKHISYDNNGSLQGFNKILNSDIINEYDKRKTYWDNTASWSRQCANNFNEIIPASKIAAYTAWFSEYNKEELPKMFFELLCTHTNNHKVIDLLRKVLRDNKISSYSKLNKSIIHAYIVKTFNFYVTNKSIKLLKYDDTKEVMPKPIVTL